MNQTSNTLFATDVVIDMTTQTLGKIIVTCIIIFLAYFLIQKVFK